MCLEYSTVLVPVPDFMLHDPICTPQDDAVFDGGEFDIDDQGRKCFRIDTCLVPALQALWAAGIRTTSCCCGHGSGSGVIGIATAYSSGGQHVMEAPPYKIIEIVERRRHENAAYERGYHTGLVDAGREDLAMQLPFATDEPAVYKTTEA